MSARAPDESLPRRMTGQSTGGGCRAWRGAGRYEERRFWDETTRRGGVCCPSPLPDLQLLPHAVLCWLAYGMVVCGSDRHQRSRRTMCVVDLGVGGWAMGISTWHGQIDGGTQRVSRDSVVCFSSANILLGSARETGVGGVARCPAPGVGCFLAWAKSWDGRG